MKFLMVFIVLCLVAYSIQSTLFEDCDDSVKEYFDKKLCMNVVCFTFKNETVSITEVSSEPCTFPKCEEGKELKETTPGNKTAIYPGCCATLICE